MKKKMRIIIILSILIVSQFAVLSQNSKRDRIIRDSLKIEIANFENIVFDLPIDTVIHTNAIYVSVFEYQVYSKIKPGSRIGKIKHHSYIINENDTLKTKEVLQINDMNIIKHYFISTKEDILYEDFKNHKLYGMYGKCIIGFSENYLIVRNTIFVSATNSRQTAPSYYTENYVYYKRID